MKFDLKEPTAEAGEYAEAFQTAVMEVSKRHVAEGKTPRFADPISALIGMLGSFAAGIPEPHREAFIAKFEELLRMAVRQSLDLGRQQAVKTVTKELLP